MIYKQLLNEAVSEFEKVGIADAKTDAFYLLEFLTGMTKADYYLQYENQVEESVINKYFDLVKKRVSHIPLQYIMGTQEFMGFSFKVTPDVLIPRQDTEMLVELALPFAKNKRVLDMCTGSGCIAVSIDKLAHPAYCEGVDISDKALAVAKENAENADSKVRFVSSDLYKNVSGKFDVIVSNPPYIRKDDIDTLMEEVKDYEPHIALDGGYDGLDFYKIIISEGLNYLVSGGRLLVETGFDQAQEVHDIMKYNGYDNITIHKDYAGNDRVVCGITPKWS